MKCLVTHRKGEKNYHEKSRKLNMNKIKYEQKSIKYEQKSSQQQHFFVEMALKTVKKDKIAFLFYLTIDAISPICHSNLISG